MFDPPQTAQEMHGILFFRRVALQCGLEGAVQR
jgi:hypothetical protein